MVTLLEQGSHTTAVNTARTLNTLADRWWYVFGARLEAAIAAVARRSDAAHSNNPKGDQRMILGWLLQDCLQHLTTDPDTKLFVALRNYYPLFGSGTGVKILQLYEKTDRPIDEQTQFLAAMLNHPVPDDTDLEATILQFLVRLLLTENVLGTAGVWQSWLDVLHHTHPDGWDVLQAKAIGCCAAQNPHLINLLVQDLLRPDHLEPRRNAIALSEAIRQGAADGVAQYLLQISIEHLSPACFNALASFLRMQGAAFTAPDQEAIAVKLQPFVEQQSERLRPAFDTLADASPTARKIFTQLVEQLPTAKQTEYQGRLLRFWPIEQHPPINTLDKRSQLFLVKLYREQAQSSSYALDQLLAAMNSKYKEVAVSASQDLDICLGHQAEMSPIIGLLQSCFPGMLVNGLKAIHGMIQQGQSLQGIELTEICTTLAREDNQAVICLLCQLGATWVQTHHQVPPMVAEAIGGAISRLAKKNMLDGGSARLLLSALKAIAQKLSTGDMLTDVQQAIVQQLKGWIISLLNQIDLIRVMNSESEVVDLLSAVHRLDETIMLQLIQQECPNFAQRQWWRNISTVVKTIPRIENRQSALFDQILASDWCSPEVESIVLEVKGI